MVKDSKMAEVTAVVFMVTVPDMLIGLPGANKTDTVDIKALKMTTDEEKSRNEIRATHQLQLFMNLIWSKTAPGNYNNANQHQLLSEFITEIANFSSSSFIIIKSILKVMIYGSF